MEAKFQREIRGLSAKRGSVLSCPFYGVPPLWACQFWVWFEPGVRACIPCFRMAAACPSARRLTRRIEWVRLRQRTLAKRLVDGAVQSHGRIDVILSNAGLMPFFPLSILSLVPVGIVGGSGSGENVTEFPSGVRESRSLPRDGYLDRHRRAKKMGWV